MTPTYTLTLSPAEALWMVDTIGAFSEFPPRSNEWALRDIPPGLRDDTSCGPMFRLRLIGVVQANARTRRPLSAQPYQPFEVTLQELWLLDAVLAMYDIRLRRFIDGQPYISLAVRVWDGLLAMYGDELPEYLRLPGGVSGGAPESRDALDAADRLLKSLGDSND